LTLKPPNAERGIVGGSVVADMIGNRIMGVVVDGAVPRRRRNSHPRLRGLCKGRDVAVWQRPVGQRLSKRAPIACGGVVDFPGDIVIADEEESVVVVPPRDAAAVVLKTSEIQRIKSSTKTLAAR
jgi:regulator of RNase E activity RraA